MIKVFPDIEELNNFAADKFVEIARESIEKRGKFTAALSGGSTPKALFQLLASDKFRDKVDWAKVFFFFGDERNVLPDDAESNFRMANENLFQPLNTAAQNILYWNTELDSTEEIAQDYATTLTVFFEAQINFPRFDLILLGIGADGHTASLFPFTEALGETEKIAVANYVEKLNDWRFTLTFPVINNARNVIFLVAGEEKAETLREVLDGEFKPEKLPSQQVRPANGNLFWLVDQPAARFLSEIFQ
ncbi:MAG TPA: 6-phosphogluconolactonase [Pyrinomonadaceae bacterium]|jgi:6-phosphogluconolactonase